MYCVASAVQWAGTWQWSARPYRFSCHPAPEALPLDRVNRKGEGKPLALAMGQVTICYLLLACNRSLSSVAASAYRELTKIEA